VAIVGSGLTVINSGTITGGSAGGGGAQANAITFSSGTNVLELRSGSTINGNVVAVSGGSVCPPACAPAISITAATSFRFCARLTWLKRSASTSSSRPGSSATAIETSRALARNEGIPGGISSGAAIAAALQIGKRPDSAGKTILAIVPSFSERYLSTALFEGI
jgi:hypothetical protein